MNILLKVTGSWTGIFVATVAWAQGSGMEAETKTQFDNLSGFMVSIITGPVAKIVALILLLIGIWKIVNKDYGAAVGCVMALLTLVFLPQMLSIFGR